MVSWINNFENPETAFSLLELVWVVDGVEEPEVAVVERLSYMSNDSVEAARTTIGLSWFRDGITDNEAKTVEDLAFIASDDPGTALGVLSLDVGGRRRRGVRVPGPLKICHTYRATIRESSTRSCRWTGCRMAWTRCRGQASWRVYPTCRRVTRCRR